LHLFPPSVFSFRAPYYLLFSLLTSPSSADMSDALDRIAPEDRKGNLYRHADEGLDDMPAHIKSALIGASVSVPITNGKLNTGTWQGVWFLEFRAAKQQRKIVATIMGEKMK
jgi:secondary thiamine-phosphate synthase enzyme